MSSIQIALVEDDSKDIQMVLEYLERFRAEKELVITVHVFRDGEDITENYKAEYDIILLDIQMRFMDGMTAARKIREKDQLVKLIFLTNTASFAIQGYEVGALDYILKPVSYEVFSIKLARAVDRLKLEPEYAVLVSTYEGVVKIPVSHIRFIEARSHQMIYQTKEGEYSTRGRLNDLEKELVPYGFYRINRGMLVNLAHVSAVWKDCCVVEGEPLPISRQKKSDFMRTLTQYL